MRVFVSTDAFSLLPDVIKVPLSDAVGKMTEITENAKAPVNSDVAVDIVGVKDAQFTRCQSSGVPLSMCLAVVAPLLVHRSSVCRL